MPRNIHALMQDTDDTDALFYDAVDYNVRSGENLEVTLANLVAGATEVRIFRHLGDDIANIPDVLVCLFDTPVLGRVFPYLIDIGTGSRAKNEATH